MNEKVIKLAEAVLENGGRAMLVGGCVRDELMGIEPKDWDLEVYGIEAERLKEILDRLAQSTRSVKLLRFISSGRIWMFRCPAASEKPGAGIRVLRSKAIPEMSFEEASKRRDFTINAILKDPLTGELIDLYGGREDIDKKILRAVSAETFPEDSLRVLRAAQFAARLEFDIEPGTVEICRKIDLTDFPLRESLGRA